MAVLRVTRAQALTWRLGRQHLLGGAGSPVDVVRTLAAVSVNGSDPDLAVRRRLADPGAPGEVARALADGRLLRTFSFRGSVQVMAPETAGAYLAVRAAGRQWARRSWVDHYRLAPDDWPDLRRRVREAVAGGPVPTTVVADALRGTRFDHVARELAAPNITLLKAFCWQGDVALGPELDGPLLLQSPATAPAWSGIPPLDEAGPRTVLDHVAAYGPCALDQLEHWLGGGLSAGRSRLRRWWEEVQDRLVVVDVDGEERWVLVDDATDLADLRPRTTVVLLPGKDAWVMGPGTQDTFVVPAEHRTSMTRGAHPVLVDGVVRGTWKARGGEVEVDCPGAPSAELAAEVRRAEGLLRSR